jgi:anti-sigma regulatory factor (Ser/Thr protein kinase)
MNPVEPGPAEAPSPRALSLGRWRPALIRSVAFTLPGGVPAPGVARHRMLEALGDVLNAEERANLALLISELVTNAVKHGGMVAEDDLITVHAGVTPDRTRIEVCDTGPGFASGAPVVRSFEGGSGGGLGLVLLDRLAAVWGVASDENVCVWAEFARTSAEAS